MKIYKFKLNVFMFAILVINKDKLSIGAKQLTKEKKLTYNWLYNGYIYYMSRN